METASSAAIQAAFDATTDPLLEMGRKEHEARIRQAEALNDRALKMLKRDATRIPKAKKLSEAEREKRLRRELGIDKDNAEKAKESPEAQKRAAVEAAGTVEGDEQVAFREQHDERVRLQQLEAEALGEIENLTAEQRRERMEFEIAKIHELEEIRENSHAAQLERLRREEEAERRRVKTLTDGFDAFASIAEDSGQIAGMLAEATGASAAAQARAVTIGEGIQSIAMGAKAIAQGGIEIAAQNYAKGAALIVAGAAATGVGIKMLTGDPPRSGGTGAGGGGGFGGADFGPGQSQRSGRSRQQANEGPEGPVSRPENDAAVNGGSASNGGGRGGRTVVIEQVNVSTLATDREGLLNDLRIGLNTSEREIGGGL